VNQNAEKLELRLTLRKRLRRILFSLFIQKIFLSGSKARITRLSAQFVFTTHEAFPAAKFFHSREKLWNSFTGIVGDNPWIGFEFGVASGDATKTFLKMPYALNCLQWNGFDTFFGLPNAWGDLPAGAFSTNGVPPKIENQIVNWHVGLIEKTCTNIQSLNLLDHRFIVIFDFDLYSATKSAWTAIEPYLKSGDILYFDEAYESDESQIIDEIFASNKHDLGVLGYTTMGIAFAIN
jgi:hypothetical protein